MSYIPDLASVVAFQSDPTKLLVNTGSNSVITLQAGVRSASISGIANIAGSVVSFQGTSPWVITGSVQTTVNAGNSSVQVLNFPANQSISGAVTQGTTPWIITGSVQTTVTTGNSSVQVLNFPANQSVSGTIATTQSGTWISSIVNIVPSSVLVGASIFGQLPAGTAPIGSVATLQGTNPWVVVGSVYGSGSVVAFQGGTQITSVSGLVNVSGSIAGTYTEQNVATSVTGLAMLFKSNNSSSVMSVPSPNTPFPITGNASVTGTMSVLGTVPVTQSTSPWIITGSVQTTVTTGNSSVQVLNFPTNQSVSGTVATTQSGTWISSIVNTVPSSVIVGASIFGLAPVNVTNTNLNVGGSVVAFQGAGWSGSVASQIKSGSVIAVLGGNTSIAGTYAEDAAHTTGDKGLFVLGVRNDTMSSLVSADLDYGALATDSQGRLVVKPFVPEDATIISYTGSIVSTSVQLIQASAVGKKSYITDFWLSNTGATTTLVTLQDGSTSVLGKFIAPTTGGMSSPGLAIPLKTAPSQDLAFTVSAATSVLYLTVKGYQAQ